MPYDNIISRGDIGGRVPDDVAQGVLQAAAEASSALAAFRTIRLATTTQRINVLSALPVAYFVAGDTGLKQTTEMAWGQAWMQVEEIACIVPVPDNVLDDINFDLFGEVRPRLVEAIGRSLDGAVFLGLDKPPTWPQAIIPAAVAAGNVIARGGNTPQEGGVLTDISDALALLEADGFEATRAVANTTLRGVLRNVRDTTGQLVQDASQTLLWGTPISYGMKGMWEAGLDKPEMLLGDFSTGFIGVRQDITFDLADQAALTDNTGAIIYNLWQQDMQALRVKYRVGWTVQVPYQWGQAANAYPFAVMKSPAT